MKIEVRKSDIIKVVILALVIIWILCFFVDYYRARQGKMPLVCFASETKTYDDGKVYSCTSFGYKMYKYERATIPVGVQFGPFFIKERTK